MAKIKCPGCGADIDTESGRAEYSAPAAAPAAIPLESLNAEHDEQHTNIEAKARKPSRFWRQNG